MYVGAALLPSLSQRIPPHVRGRVFVLTSPAIWELWSGPFLASFPADRQPLLLLLPPGEPAKRLGEIERLCEEMAQAGADRSSLLIAFGGGILGDMGGFLAAIYMRGIPYVQVPTTVLAQVDSSVGGKTGANLAAGKNLVGAFHHPLFVLADTDVLRTLPGNEVRAGLIESVKAGIIRDPELFRLMEESASKLTVDHPQLLADVIARSVAIKSAVVGEDEREGGLRMILNLGHTVGHAIEAVTGYTVLLHGEAVGWGMLVAIGIAASRGLMTAAEQARAVALVRTVGQLPPFQADGGALLAATGRDKKNAGGTRRFVLPRGIGDAAVVEDVSDRELLGAIESMLREANRDR